MLHTFVIADSRHVMPRSFEIEAAFATYHQFLLKTIPKYIAICDSHSWITKPDGLVILTDSPHMPKIIGSRFLDISIASKLLEPPTFRFAGMSINLAGDTWCNYLVNALNKISEMIRGSSSEMNSKSNGKIVIYSSDLLLLGDSDDVSKQSVRLG
jgi:hypothetical protein